MYDEHTIGKKDLDLDSILPWIECALSAHIRLSYIG